jgi:23S rRNA pseudouridine1911/1915/1917 synthase
MEEKNIEERQDIKEEFYETHEIIADPKQTPLRIDKFLMDKLAKVSRSRVQAAIRAGAIKVNDKDVKPNFKIKPGHKINVVLPRSFDGDTTIVPEDIPLDIRYEDDDLLIVHKPPGLVVHPGIGNRSGTLVNALAWHFKDLPVMEGNSNDRVGLVHRIDKDTSGLLVIAKSDYAMTHLAKQFFDHSIDRTYHALVWGDMESTEGTITGNIGRHPRTRKIYTVFPDGEEGKHAVTHFKILRSYYYVTLVECRLETGRTHQIRVHMKHTGHPIFNDSSYGGDKIMKGTVFSKYKSFVQNTFKVLPRQALHAKSLGFVHPTTGEYMFFEAELPEDFQNAMNRWEKYLDGRKTTMDMGDL